MGRNIDVESCGRAIAAIQDGSLDPSEPDDAVMQRIADEAGAPPRGRSRRRVAGVALSLSLSTVVIVALLLRARSQEKPTPSPLAALAFTVGDPPVPGRGKDLLSAPAAASIEVRFSEGTTVSLRPAARARVLDVTASGAEILLESGRARFEVVHRPEARWQVRSGSYVIQVIGTKFETEYEPRTEELTVVVDEGAVTVSGCGLGPSRVVRAGERVKASCPPRMPDVGSRLGPEPDAGKSRVNAPAETRGRSWVDLARRGLYAEAYDHVKHDFERECQSREASELWLLGDAARLSGHGRQAQRAYQALRQRFRGTAMTADAAFALGRLAIDLDGDATAAERWFETNLGEQPNGVLAPSALGRIMDLRLERGDRKGAADVAREYLRRFPAGSRAAGAKVLLAAPGEAARTGSAR